MKIRRSAVQQQLDGDQLDRYNLLLVDTEHYTLDAIRQWLVDLGIKTTQMTVHRDRKAALAAIEGIKAKRELAEHMYKQANEEGWDIARLGADLAGQRIFDAISSTELGSLDSLSVTQYIRLLEVAVALRGTESKARMVDAQREAMERTLRAELAKATKSGDAFSVGVLDDAAIDRISKAVFGGGNG